MNVPAFLPYYVLIGSIGIIAALLFALRASLINAGWPAVERARRLRIASIVLIGWFVLATALAASGIYRGDPERLPRIEFGLIVPVVLGLILLWRSSAFKRLIEAVPQHWLVGVQLYRALGLIFLVLLGMERLPGAFAWPAGAGDIVVGLLAPVVAVACLRDPRGSAGWVLAWNVLGLLDLGVAVTTGVLTSPSPIQRLALDAPNELISVFPLALIPTFLVPISIVLHVASLKKLYQQKSFKPGHDLGAQA